MRKNIKCFELSIRSLALDVGAVDVAKIFLKSHGILEKEIIEYKIYPYEFLKVYFFSREKGNKIFNLFKQQKLKKLKVVFKEINSRVWQKKGSEVFKPFQLTKSLKVIPYKDRSRFKKIKHKTIILKTGLAFGTGLHETTRFMANLIEERKEKLNHFLDIGTGTGILTLVALKNKAGVVKAIDLSKDCIKVARENLELNGFKFSSAQAINFAKLKVRNKFSFVAANLITKDLIRFKNKLLNLLAPAGCLAISGISLDNFDYLREEFKSLPIKCKKVVKGNQWAAVLFLKK